MDVKLPVYFLIRMIADIGDDPVANDISLIADAVFEGQDESAISLLDADNAVAADKLETRRRFGRQPVSRFA